MPHRPGHRRTDLDALRQGGAPDPALGFVRRDVPEARGGGFVDVPVEQIARKRGPSVDLSSLRQPFQGAPQRGGPTAILNPTQAAGGADPFRRPADGQAGSDDDRRLEALRKANRGFTDSPFAAGTVSDRKFKARQSQIAQIEGKREQREEEGRRRGVALAEDLTRIEAKRDADVAVQQARGDTATRVQTLRQQFEAEESERQREFSSVLEDRRIEGRERLEELKQSDPTALTVQDRLLLNNASLTIENIGRLRNSIARARAEGDDELADRLEVNLDQAEQNLKELGSQAQSGGEATAQSADTDGDGQVSDAEAAEKKRVDDAQRALERNKQQAGFLTPAQVIEAEELVKAFRAKVRQQTGA